MMRAEFKMIDEQGDCYMEVSTKVTSWEIFHERHGCDHLSLESIIVEHNEKGRIRTLNRKALIV